ncbi:putative coatomer, WD associated region [Plasmopara halstedii]
MDYKTVQHNSNGRYVVVCGDGEYIIYTAQQLRNKDLVRHLTFVGHQRVKSEKPRVVSAEGLFGGTGAIGVKGNDAIAMFDWEELRLIRKIDVAVKNAFGRKMALCRLACDSSFYVLRYNKELVAQALLLVQTRLKMVLMVRLSAA